MNQLEKFIQDCLKKKEQYTELELVRYIYIKLGEMMSFNLEFFYGSNEIKDKIYQENTMEDLIDSFENQTIICKSLSYIFEYILKKLDIHAESIVDDNIYETHCHVYNIVSLNDGRKIMADLQLDLENIKSHQKTTYFGPKIISDEQLENIDMKIGYISKDNYYAESYYNLLEKAISSDISLKQKLHFILQNVNVYADVSNMGYFERKKYYSRFIRRFLNDKEKSKIHFFDTYEIKDNKEYRFGILLEDNKTNSIYIYSNDKNSFEEYNTHEFEKLIENGLNLINDISEIYKNNKRK